MSTGRECPVCKKAVLPRPLNPGFPFCSARCRAVDLGKWLTEEYRLPDRHVEDQEDELQDLGNGGDGSDA